MFKRLFTSLRSEKGLNVPAIYDPKLHYNCFVETVREADRQAVYQELRRKGWIEASHFLPDGRLQLSIQDLSTAIEAYNAVAEQKVTALRTTKAHIIELKVTNPEMEMTFVKTNVPGGSSHAEKIALREIAIDSDESFRKGVAYMEKKQYEKAIECWDEAIRIEPQDVRAWCNKIIALAQLGKHRVAIEVANEILGRHTNIGLLWESKGLILAEMGQMIEAGECMSIACELNPVIAKRHAAQMDLKADKRLQALMTDCRKAGKNPETDVAFWFGKFGEYSISGDAERAVMCLQMAATIGPNYSIMHRKSQIDLLPPGHVLLSKEHLPHDAKIESLRDFFQRLTTTGKVRQ